MNFRPEITTRRIDMKYEIKEIEGIGPAYAEKLETAGIKTTDDLLNKCGAQKGRKDIAEKKRRDLLPFVPTGTSNPCFATVDSSTPMRKGASKEREDISGGITVCPFHMYGISRT